MPDGNKSPKDKVIFALAVVKHSVISNRAESSKIEAALQILFPGVSIILVAEDDEIASYQRRRDLADFAASASSRVVASSKISAN